MTSRQEIEGISGWSLVAPLMGNLPTNIAESVEKCESPIEQLFAAALGLVVTSLPAAERPSLDTQVQISKYRADIVLTGPHGAPRIVIECDGAEFHKNIGKDAKRTAEIEQHGYRVLRVTGSEIHHNPLARAKSLLREAGFARTE